MKERIAVYEDGSLGFISFSDKDTHDHYTYMAVADGKIYLVGTTAGESEIAVYDMTGERIGSIPVPPETNVGAYALYEENDSLMLLSHDLKCFRLENGSFVRENGFTVDDPRNINGKIKVSFNGTDIMIDAGDCTALGVYRIANDRIFCIDYGTNVTYRVYDLSGELIGASSVDGSIALYYPISPMFVSPEGSLYVMNCTNDGVYITKPHLRK